MWARLHKLDRVKPLAAGGAIVTIDDDRPTTLMQRNPSLSTLVAVARILSAHRALEAKFDGKGEVRYQVHATVPSFLSEAIARAGGALSDGDRMLSPAAAAGVAAIIDVAFAERFEIDRFAVSLDQDDGARNFSSRDLIFEKLVDPREFFDRQRSVRRGPESISWNGNDHRDHDDDCSPQHRPVIS